MFQQDGEEFREKYKSGEFDVVEFALEAVQQFIPAATWRWVGGKHEAHVYAVTVCSILVTYGVLTSHELYRVKKQLVQKIQILKQLEQVIKRD